MGKDIKNDMGEISKYTRLYKAAVGDEQEMQVARSFLEFASKKDPKEGMDIANIIKESLEGKKAESFSMQLTTLAKAKLATETALGKENSAVAAPAPQQQIKGMTRYGSNA